MKVLLNRAHYPVTVLGPGTRIGLWLQGCSLACKGCMSTDTWAHDASKAIDIEVLIAWCRKVAPAGPDGVTISGGEPFEQPEALEALLEALHDWRTELQSPFDVLCYSGFRYKWLQTKHPSILSKLDALIPEPFVQSQPKTEPWRGSANQPLVVLSVLGGAKYESSQSASPPNGGLQSVTDAGRIWYVGVPERGAMDSIEEELGQRGVDLAGKTWT